MEDRILGYRRRLDSFPANREAFQGLAEAYAATSRWEDLARLYEERLGVVPDDAGTLELRFQLGGLYLERLSDAERALAHLRRVYLSDPTRTESLEALIRIHETRTEWDRVEELLVRRARLAEGTERAAILLRLAVVQAEHLGRSADALETCSSAAEADPTSVEPLRRARALALELGDLPEAVALLDREAEVVGTEGLGVEYLHLGRTLADQPWERDLARRLLERARDLGEADSIDEILQALEEQGQRWKELSRSLRAEAVDAREKRKAAAAYLKIAQLHALYDDDPRKVAENVERVFLLYPGSTSALDFLERFHGDREDWAGLVETYERVVSNVKDRTASAGILVRLARLHARRLQDAEAAVAAYQRALEQDPAHREAAESLLEILESAGDWAQVADVLGKRLAAVGERGEQVRLHLELARVAASHLEDGERARGHLEAVLELEPEHLEAARALEPLAQQAEAWEALARCLEIQLEGMLETEERRRILQQLAQVQVDHLSRPVDAVRCLARALVLEPAHPDTLSGLEAAAQAAGDLPLFGRALAIAADAAEGEGRIALLLRLASLREQELEDPVGAGEVYRLILSESEDHPDASAGLERVLASTGNHEELVVAMERQLAHEGDAAKARALRLKLAREYEEAMNAPDKALELYATLLAESDEPGLRTRYEALLERLGHWEQLAGVLESRLAESGDETGALPRALARIYAEHLYRAGDAAVIYCGLFEEAPEQAGLVDALQALFEQGVETGRISALLEPWYATAGDWARHLAMLEHRLTFLSAPAERALHLARIAEVHEDHLVDKRQALVAISRAFRETPDELGLLEKVERLARDTGAFAELEEALRFALETGLEAGRLTAEQALSLRQRLATLRERELHNPQGAASVYVEILRQTPPEAPAHREALEALARMARATERFTDLIQALERLVQIVPEGKERIPLLLELGSLELQQRGDGAAAATRLQAALAAGAGEAKVLPLLSDALERAGDVEGLARILERRAELADASGDGQLSSRLKLKHAQLLSEGLGDVSQAVAQYRAVLTDRPSDPDALAALEKLLEDPAQRVQAARALAPAYEKAQEYARLVRVLEIETQLADSPALRAAVLRRISEVQERHLRDRDLALATLGRAVIAHPHDADLRRELRRVADEMGALGAVPQVLERAAAVMEAAEGLGLLKEAAEWVERRMGDPRAAIARYETMLGIDPGYLDALRALHRLHRSMDHWPALAGVCIRLAEVIEETSEKIRLWREAGRLQEEGLEDPSAAAEAFRKILEVDPADQEAARALTRLYQSLGRLPDLAWVLETEAGVLPDGDRRRDLTLRLAEVYRQLDRPEAALALYGPLLERDSVHPPTRAALDEMVRQGGAVAAQAAALLEPALLAAGEHRTRIDTREARLSRADADGLPEAERAQLYAEIREIYEGQLDAPEMAFMAACRQLAAGIDFESARDEAERLAEKAGTEDELTEVFEEAAGALQEDPARKLDLLRRVAQIRSRIADSPDEAIVAWKKVQLLVPEDRSVLDALEALYNRKQDAQDLVGLYRQKVDMAASPAEKAESQLELARLLEQTGAVDQAIETFERVAALASELPDPAGRALFQLDRLHQKGQRFADLARVLASLVKLLGEDPARFDPMLRLAQLFESHDSHPARALEMYGALLAKAGIPEEAGTAPGREEALGAIEGLERLLGHDAAKVKAAAFLEPVYRERMEGRKLIDVLELRLEASRSAEERLEMLREIARLYEVRLGQKPLAFMVWCRAFKETPADSEVRDRLAALAAETEAWDELVGVYEDELDRLGQGAGRDAQRLELHRTLAGVYETRLAQLDRAVRHLRAVTELDPDDVSALEDLARLLRETQSRRELVEVYRRLVTRLDDAERAKDLWYEIAGISEEVIGDKAAAVEAWREVLALDGDQPDPEVLTLIGRLLTELERWEEYCEVLGQELVLAGRAGGGPATANLQHRLGRVAQVRLEEPVRAVEAYAAALEAVPGHASSISALEELLAGGSASEGVARDAALRAARLLEPHYAEQGDVGARIRTLELLASASPDPESRCELLMGIADLYVTEQDSPEMAFMAASRALRALPISLKVLSRIEGLAEAAELHEEEAELLSELVGEVREEPSLAQYHRRLGEIYSDAGEVEDAVPHWQALLSIVPNDSEALDRLERLNRLQGDWESVVEVLRRQLQAAEDEGERARVLGQMGALQDERLEDPVGALASYRQVLEVVPDDREVLGRVDALCIRQERWTELEEVLQREAEAASAAEDLPARVAFLFRLARLREEHLLDPAGAMDLYKELLSLSPGHPDTVAHLEAILDGDASRADVARLLEDVYRAQSQWTRLLSMLEIRAAHEPEREDRASVLWEMHEIHEQRLEAPEMAFIVLCRAFNESPGAANLRAALERLAELTEQYEELIAVFEDAMEVVGVPEVVASMNYTIGRVQEEKLRDLDEAATHYERVLRYDETHLPSLKALDRLYRRNEAWLELAVVLEREAALTEDADERAAVLFRLGQMVAEKLGQPDRAASVYERLLEVEPGHLPALRALEHLYEEAGAWEDLAGNIEAQLGRAKDAQAKERLTGRLAEVLGRHLHQHDRAIELWKQVLEMNRRSEAANLALEEVYEAAGYWQLLADLLRLRLTQTLDPREITRLNDKLGWVLGAKLGEAEQAIRSFKAVLDRDPRNVRALDALKDIYAAQGEWEELVVVLKRLVPLQEQPQGAKDLRFRLAAVLGRELGRREEAIEAAKRFLDIEPHQAEELEQLEKLLRDLRAVSDAVQVMQLRARVLEARMTALQPRLESLEEMDPEAVRTVFGEVREARVQLLFGIARSHAEELRRAEGGVAALEELLSIEPGNREAYQGLRKLYETSTRWRELAGLLDRFLPHAQDKEERKALQVEMSTLQEQRLGQKEMAFIALGRAFSEDSGDERIEKDLFRLAGDTESWDELAMILEEVAENEEPGPRKEHLFLHLAQVHDEHLDDADEAESAIRKVLAFDMGSRPALDALASLFVRRGQSRALITALEQKLEATGEPDEQKDILGRMAHVFEEQLEDLEEAVGTWRRVLELDGGDRTALDELARIFEGQGRWEELISTLDRAVQASGDERQRAELKHRVGLIQEERLGNDDPAISAMRAALEWDAGFEPALTGLERIYTRLERWSELLQTYEAKVEATSDEPEQIRILLKIASLQESHFESAPKAIDAYDRVLALDPEHLAAVKGLARHLRAENAWERLIETLGQQIGLTREVPEAVRLHVELGQVWYEQLGRVDEAEKIFNHALEIEPESRQALRVLGTLYESSGNWNLALEMMGREARLAGMGDDAVELWFRMGRIQEDMLLDTAAARANYEQALDIEASYLPAIRALKSIAELDKDWDKYLEALIQEAKHTSELGEKTRLLYQIGVFYRDQREDAASALRYFEEALTKTEDDLPAAQDAAALHLAEQAWPRAEELLRIVAAGHEAAGEDPKDLCQWWYKLGYVRQKLEQDETALDAYRRAYDCDSTYLPVLEGLGGALVRTQKWEEALKVYQTILIHHRDSVTDLEVVEYYWQLGEINRHLGQGERAIKNFEKALELEPDHEPALSGAIRLLEDREEWETAIEYRQRLLQTLDGQQHFDMLLSIGRLSSQKLEDPYQAIDAYLAAHREQEEAVAPLESLLVLYRETQQSAKAVDVLEKLLALWEIREDSGKSRQYHATLAEIFRDDLKDVDKAIEHFNAALDIDYTYVSAFVAVEEILGRQKRWGDLEQAYIAMIQRLPKTAQTNSVRLGLWKTLGELYRKVLRNLDGAIAAYQVVTKADKDDAEAVETLAELLAQKPGAEKQAVAAFHEALKVTSEPVRVARALLRLHSAQKNYDKAYSVAAVITHLLGDAQPDEQKLYDRLKPYGKDQARRQLTDRLWEQHLYHEKLKGPVADILAIVYEQAGSHIGLEPKDLGLNARRDSVDVAQSMLYFANMYKYVGRILGSEGVPLYKAPQQGEALAVGNTWPVCLIASEEMLGRSNKRQLWFSIAKAMAFTRPELALGRVHSLEELDLILQAAASLVNPRFPVSLDPREIQRVQRQLQRGLSPEAVEALTRVVRAWKPDRALTELRAYAEGVEHTANRAGILMAGDVEVARAALMEDRGGAAKLPLRSKVRELVMFCLSEEYFQLREALGLAVEIPR